MGFDLRARNKGAADFCMGAFSWSWMLNAGVGLPVGHGEGGEPASFCYKPRPDGKCLGHNDGARVSAKEAKQMAMVARWVADHEDRLHELWMRLSDAERERRSSHHGRLYRIPVRRDFVDKARAFADWAEKSGGFRVY